jgi:hypothetical protein
MILYNVTINVEDTIHNEWVHWMKHVHIPEVLSTGLFIESRFLKLLTTEEDEGNTYSVQYFLDSLEKFKTYEEQFAPALRKKTLDQFGSKFVAFRTLLETV